jgi:hydrogenase maturation factor
LKIFYLVLSVLLIAVGYFLFNPSYKLSTEARVYYSIGEYGEAYRLSSEALEKDIYNSMAIHIKSRSGKTLELIKFNKESEEASQQIIELIKKGELSRGDKVRLKMISDVVIGNYEKLHLNVIDDEVLKEEAKKYLHRFQKLNKEAIEFLGEKSDISN